MSCTAWGPRPWTSTGRISRRTPPWRGAFQPVFVSEPSLEETISILRGLKEKYELHHGVRMTDSAIVAAATLSNRYISDRFLPDKAIDLIDEAGSRLRMEVDSKPEEIDELDRKLVQLKIEETALKKENDKASKERLEKLTPADCRPGGELAGADRPVAGGKGQAGRCAEDQGAAGPGPQRAGNRPARRAPGPCQRAEVRHPCRSWRKQLAEGEAAEEHRILNEVVTDQDVAYVVSRWTGIPVDKMLEGEREKAAAHGRVLCAPA